MQADASDGETVRAVLLDAHGTLVDLDAPVARLRASLRRHCGLEVSEPAAAAALRAEVAFYRAHLHLGADAEGLAALRRRSAEVLREALPPSPGGSLDAVLAALLQALRFRPFPEVPAALARLGALGLQLVVVSNWDVSLHAMLRETGLDALLDGAVSSAEAGASKPDPAIFTRALELAGVDAEQALHVGDRVDEDLEGARAAGVAGLLLDRGGTHAGPDTLRSLADLPARLGEPAGPAS